MKKNGIIVGVVLFILALVVYWLATSIGGEDKPKEEVPKPQAIQAIAKPTEPQKPAEGVKEEKPKDKPAEGQGNNQSSGQQATAQPTPSQTKQTTFIRVSDGDIGLPKGQYTEKMKVAKKNVTVMDYKPGTNEGKQMVYTVDLQGEKRDITIFVNGEVYYGLVIGRELSVMYSIYTNDSGIEFPVVDKVLEVIQ